MTQFTKRYYPTVCVRRAEMKALEMLPKSEKQKMLPVVLLAPWLNSIEFDNTFRIIQKSLEDVPIIVDLDRYFHSDSDLPSRQYFKNMLNPETGPEIWTSLIKENLNYIPCIQIFNVSEEKIQNQIDAFKGIGRGFAFRIELNRKYNFDILMDFIKKNSNEDIIIIIDYGYSKSNDLIEAKLSSVIDRLISISASIKFVTTGASFPNEFSDYDNFSDYPIIHSRIIYENLSRKYGNYNIFYGDWASTKPRAYDGGGSKPLPRIDFPTSSKWIIARSKDDEWNFQDAAEQTTRLNEWQDRPIIWGTGVIEKAAKGLPGGISTGPQAIAARVNIHLYVQNNIGAPPTAITPKGKWIDPI